MVIYLIQHGKAKTKEEDPERGLTEEGREEAERVSAFFTKLSPDIHVIWHSGKKRARETAEIIAGSLNIQNRIMEHTGLNPNDNISDIQGILEKSQHTLVIVGHLPHLARLCSKLMTGDETREVIHFKNAGIVCLQREETGWVLEWMITPEILP
ncbi:MAG TPA: phosphohistidine phosphatase SixA [Spirochaetia bacterium]|nr:phosphohistidine phosphatase SixA [Spirochaetia bacterium]